MLCILFAIKGRLEFKQTYISVCLENPVRYYYKKWNAMCIGYAVTAANNSYSYLQSLIAIHEKNIVIVSYLLFYSYHKRTAIQPNTGKPGGKAIVQ